MMINFSVSHTVHKQGQTMNHIHELHNQDSAMLEAQQSVPGFAKWAISMIQALKQSTVNEVLYSQRSLIQKINAYIRANLENDVSLQSIADHVFLHPVYVSKLYKSETGEGISDYIFRLRMERAAHLLIDTNEKIADICRKVGYQNPSHFSRVFKKHYQKTPDEYREHAH